MRRLALIVVASVVMAVNIKSFVEAGVLSGWDKALYSMIFRLASAQIVNMLDPCFKRTTLFIISDRTQAIYEEIKDTIHHGATLSRGIGLYNGEPREMVYPVIAGDRVKNITQQVRRIDPHAFISILKTDKAAGNFCQRPND